MKTLKNRSDFLTIAKNGKRCSTPSLVLQALATDLDCLRVGYTVTKATEKSAVRRNRIKRRLRAAARDVFDNLAKPSCDYVLIGKSQAAERSFDQLCRDIQAGLEKTGFLKNGT